MIGTGRLVALDARDAADREEWLSLWNDWPGREVSAHPAYVALFASEDETPLCMAFRGVSGGAMFPLIRRPLSALPFVGPGWCSADLTSPYGYGGPFAWNITAEEAAEFWTSFSEWAAATSIVTVFTRLSLFPDQLLPFDGDVYELAPNIVMPLAGGSAASMWRAYDHKVRKNVNRARQSGLSIVSDAGERLDDFMEIYELTMDRRGALAQYYFPRAFFEALVERLAGHFRFFHVLARGRVVSTELVLVSADNVYSFLGGTDPASFELRPNDLLKHTVAEWAIGERKSTYVLGGGYQAGDGIYRYKKSFAPDGVTPFRVGRRVIDPACYAELQAARAAWESSQGNEWAPRPGFFPAYRG